MAKSVRVMADALERHKKEAYLRSLEIGRLKTRIKELSSQVALWKREAGLKGNTIRVLKERIIDLGGSIDTGVHRFTSVEEKLCLASETLNPENSTILADGFVKTKKPRHCVKCGRLIESGSRVRRVKYVTRGVGGKMEAVYLCTNCCDELIHTARD